MATAAELASGEAIDYVLSEDSWLHKNLDKIFGKRAVLTNSKTFKKAGFVIIREKSSGMMVASHPKLPGYLIKAFLSTSPKGRNDKWMVNRCRGAENVRNVIQEEALRHIIVPDKWIYYTSEDDLYAGILVVTHMQTLSAEESAAAWKKASKREIKELYAIVGKGFASIALPSNVAAIRGGKFACLDTEFPGQRKYKYSRLKEWLSPEMYEYFCKLHAKDKNRM